MVETTLPFAVAHYSADIVRLRIMGSVLEKIMLAVGDCIRGFLYS